MSSAELLHADPRVLSPLHRRIMAGVAGAGTSFGVLDLRLEGGSALSAYHLHHRQSEDLDFFAGPSMDAAAFRSFAGEQLARHGLHIVGVGPASRGFAEFYVSDQPAAVPAGDRQTVRVQFGQTSPFMLSDPVPTQEGVRVASFRDLCAGKLHAICDRFEPRDFVDLDCILSRPGVRGRAAETDIRRRFRDLLRDVQSLDPGLDEVRVGDALARGIGRPIVTGFPLALLVPLRDEDLQATLQIAHDECARIAAERMQ
ncbi:MAG: nucleotidyl transferase AbiEii/AbiGii toxin family protein [Longimicrobiales bacterium]